MRVTALRCAEAKLWVEAFLSRSASGFLADDLSKLTCAGRYFDPFKVNGIRPRSAFTTPLSSEINYLLGSCLLTVVFRMRGKLPLLPSKSPVTRTGVKPEGAERRSRVFSSPGSFFISFYFILKSSCRR